MSRAAGLAVGSIVGALASVAAAGSFLVLAAAGLAAAAILLCAFLVGDARRAWSLAIAIGALVVISRAAVGFALMPAGDGVVAGAGLTGTRHNGIVISVGAPDGGQQRAIVELQPPEPLQRVYVWLPRYPPVAPADVITFDGRLEPPPTESGFGEYLARSAISATARSRTLERVGADGSPLAALEGLRRSVAELLTRALPEPQAGLATAMAIGLRDVVARDVSDDFRTAGLSHVVAISGWHIAMLGAVMSALLSGLSRRPRSVLVLLAIASYAVLAGASPGILRAAVMASVVIIARESGRRGQAAAALSLTCAGLLILDPKTITDIGFQLSAAATAGLLAWAAPLRDRLARRLPQQTPGWLLEALAVSLAAQAATLPIVLFHFGRLSLVAPLANLLVAPLVAPAMLLTAVCVVCGAIIALGVPGLVLAPVTLVSALVIGAMVEIGRLTAGLPYANVELPEPFNMLGALASALAISLAVLRGRGRLRRSDERPKRTTNARSGWLTPRRTAAVGGAVAMSVLLVVVTLARPDGRLHVTALDVGQGDAILVQGPTGGRVLIDAGPDPDRLLALLDARIPAWDRRLDVVVLTHPHEDHVAGLALLLRRYRIGAIVESGMTGVGAGDAAYRRELSGAGRTTKLVSAGDRLWLDGIRMDVVWPRSIGVASATPQSGKEINNTSIMLELGYGARRMLLTGDLEEEVDPILLADGLAERAGDRLDVLKVSHHGSRTATSDAFVKELRPRVALISVGSGNTYGHPSPATLARLESVGARVLRTDVDGVIDVSTDGVDLVARPERSSPPSVPQPSPERANTGVRSSTSPWAFAAGTQPYNRPDVRAHPYTGDRDRHPPRAARLAAAPFHRGRRDRRVPVCCHDPPRRGHRHDTHRGGRAAP